MARIITQEDLYRYGIGLKNNGIADENLLMLETNMLMRLFGKEGAKRLINAIKTAPDTVQELLDGDDILFMGLRALLSTAICTHLLSQNQVQVARQNVSKQPSGSYALQRRNEADVVQSLSYTAVGITYALNDYLHQEGKNPLGLRVEQTLLVTTYNKNTSGFIPAAMPRLGGLYGRRW